MLANSRMNPSTTNNLRGMDSSAVRDASILSMRSHHDARLLKARFKPRLGANDILVPEVRVSGQDPTLKA